MIIIADIRTFALGHRIMLVDNNEIKFSTKASLKTLPEVICELAQKNNCNNIKLLGNAKFCEGISNNIKNTFTGKFSCKCPLNIEY